MNNCRFYPNIDGKKVEMDFDRFRAWLHDGALERILPEYRLPGASRKAEKDALEAEAEVPPSPSEKPVKTEPVAPEKPVESAPASPSANIEAAVENPSKKPPAAPEKRKSGVGVSIEAKAIEGDLTKGFEGTAEYDAVTIKDQAQKAADLVNNDLERARRIVAGKENLPNDLRAAPLITAMERLARKNGDVELLKDLAESPLTAETSIHAQEMRLLREREPNSPVKLIQELQKTREDALKKRLGKRTVKDTVKDEVKKIQNEIKKTVPKKPEWVEFIKNLQCRVD